MEFLEGKFKIFVSSALQYITEFVVAITLKWKSHNFPFDNCMLQSMKEIWIIMHLIVLSWVKVPS